MSLLYHTPHLALPSSPNSPPAAGPRPLCTNLTGLLAGSSHLRAFAMTVLGSPPGSLGSSLLGWLSPFILDSVHMSPSQRGIIPLIQNHQPLPLISHFSSLFPTFCFCCHFFSRVLITLESHCLFQKTTLLCVLSQLHNFSEHQFPYL